MPETIVNKEVRSGGQRLTGQLCQTHFILNIWEVKAKAALGSNPSCVHGGRPHLSCVPSIYLFYPNDDGRHGTPIPLAHDWVTDGHVIQ